MVTDILLDFFGTLVRYTPGSHHVLLYNTPYRSIPTRDRRGREHDTSDVFDCAEGATADWETGGVLSGAQSFAAESMVNLPDDVGIKVPGGAVLLMNTHYLNAGPSPLSTTARINVYTIPAERVQKEGGVILFYNPFIRVPEQGQASARMRCPLSQNIMLSNIQSHMHRRGVGFSASLLNDKGVPIEELYRTNEWESVPVRSFGAGKAIAAGTIIDYRCDYQNSETRPVLQGFSTRDEMCVLLGSYYPRDPLFEGCGNSTFVGSGTKNGAETLSCLQSAAGAADPMYGCIVNSCAAVAEPMTQALRCQFSRGNGACQSMCEANPNQCDSCVQQACQQVLGAFQQATC